MGRAAWLGTWGALAFVAAGSTAFADDVVTGRDPFSHERFTLAAEDLVLRLHGELEVEAHDLSGAGGPRHDSTSDLRTIGTRSPTFEIDVVRLGLALTFSESLDVFTVLDFTERSASVSGAWARLVHRGPAWLSHAIELGLGPPFVAPDRRTERYPLNGTIYWRAPELHATYIATVRPGALRASLGVSAAVMRPLVFAPVHDGAAYRGTIHVVGYGAARPYSGNRASVGARVTAEVLGCFVESFGFVGALAREGGTDELRSSFGAYADRDSAALPTRAHWLGGRAGFARHGVRSSFELIASREGPLRRVGAHGQASVEIPVLRGHVLRAAEPLLRYERYRIRGSTRVLPSGHALRSPAPSQALTWDFDIVTAALGVVVYRDLVRLRIEYAWIDEQNGVPALGIANVPLSNDELLVQLELRF